MAHVAWCTLHNARSQLVFKFKVYMFAHDIFFGYEFYESIKLRTMYGYIVMSHTNLKTEKSKPNENEWTVNRKKIRNDKKTNKTNRKSLSNNGMRTTKMLMSGGFPKRLDGNVVYACIYALIRCVCSLRITVMAAAASHIYVHRDTSVSSCCAVLW